MSVAGGLLERFLEDSTRDLIRSQLALLGWFGTNRRHREVTVLAEPQDWDVPVEANLIALYVGSTMVEEAEVGNELMVISESQAVVTVLGETAGIGLHLAGDVRDILAANMGDGRRAVIPVFDYRHATPPLVAYATVDEVVMVEPPSHARREWLTHWYQIKYITRMAYSAVIAEDDDDGPFPAPDLFPGPDLFPEAAP